MTPPKKPGGRRVDLDAARAARAESAQEPIIVVFGGREFPLPAEMPGLFAMYAGRGDIEAALGELFEEHDVKAFWALKPSIDDLTFFAEGIADEYGVDLGELQASKRS